MDELSKVTDKTLAQRMTEIPKAEAVIAEIESEFNTWAENRKFAPTIQALKTKLSEIKKGEIDNQRRKLSDFNEEQAEIISNRIIHKITTHFANHLKDKAHATDDSLALINSVFQLNNVDK